MSFVRLILKHNLKWIVALALIFAFASGVLSNASSLSQWYSKTLTADFLEVTRVDFVVNQNGVAGKVTDVHGTLLRLDEVTDVFSEIYIGLGFDRTVRFDRRSHGGNTFVTVRSRNETRFIIQTGLKICSYLKLEKLIEESGIGAPYPEPGEVVISRDLARLLDMHIGDNLVIETPGDLLTFRVSGITDLSRSCIQEKIRKPELQLRFVPPSPLEKLQFEETVSGELFMSYTHLCFNWFVIISPEDSVDMFSRDWMTKTFDWTISHFVYTERQDFIEPLNLDRTVSSILKTKGRIELAGLAVPASVSSDVLELFETAAWEVNLFAVTAGGFMLAALPLYWFIGSPLTNLFLETKRGEIALFRIRGLSLRQVAITYMTLITVSAIAGGVLGALLQANMLQILVALQLIGPQYASAEISPMLPEYSSLVLYVIISLVLAIVSLRKITTSLASLQPVETTRHVEKSETKHKRVGKMSVLLLCLGLIKILLLVTGWDSTVYFKFPPSNPFLAMGVSIFAALDNYALTPLAPVFVAYGFAKVISAKSDKFKVLLWPFSLLAGLRKREISFRLLSSEMWRVAASFTLVTLVLSYGVASHIANCTVNEHIWTIAKEFTGADIRVDSFPNVTQRVEETVRTMPELSNYTRIDILASEFTRTVGHTTICSFMPIVSVDPETYVEVAYLDNTPEFREAVTGLELGHLIALKGVQGYKYFGGPLMTECSFPVANISKDWSEIIHGRRLMSNETVVFRVDGWFNITVPGTVESMETVEVKRKLGLERVDVYEPPTGKGYWWLAEALLPHTSEGALFDFGKFVMRHETKLEFKHEHIKSIFLIKLVSEADVDSAAKRLRSTIDDGNLVVTRSEAVEATRRGFPRLAVSLDFTEINCILITAISLAGLAAIVITTTMGRKSILSLLRIRGGRRKDNVALFLPETALILFLGCLFGTAIGMILGIGFVNSMTDLIPPLFTGSPIRIIFGSPIWYFTAAVLVVFFLVQLASVAFKSVIDLKAV